MDLGFNPNSQGFFHRVQEVIAFVAHMGGIERARAACKFGQGHDFFGLTVASRMVNQARRKPASALFKCPLNMAAHGL